MKEFRAIFTVFLTLLVSLTVLHGADLPMGHKDFVPTPERPVGWRGDGTGQYPGAEPPLEWSETNNIIWKTAMPSWTFSTPVPACGKVFTCAEPAMLLCLDAKTGAVLWSHNHDQLGGKLATGVNSRNSTPTPVCDGTRVYARFANGVNVAYDLDGNRQWLIVRGDNTRNASIMDASPALLGNRLIICLGRELLGLDTATGKEVWKHDTGNVDSGAHSPVIVRVGEAAVLIPGFGRALDPGNGHPITPDLGINACNTSPIFMDGVVYAVGEKRGGKGWNAAVRLEPGATGIAVKELWKNRFGGAIGKSKFPDGPLGADVQERFYASPLIYGGMLITQNQFGNLYAINPETGGILKMLDLAKGAGTHAPQAGSAFMSPAVAGGRLLIRKRDGPVVVFQGKALKEVARNYLDMSGVTADMGGVHSFDSSLAFQGNHLFLRTHEALYCIGAP